MNQKKAYVSPQVIRVKLEPSQAVLSQCEVDIIGVSNLNPAGFCNAAKNCKQRNQPGNNAATS